MFRCLTRINNILNNEDERDRDRISSSQTNCADASSRHRLVRTLWETEFHQWTVHTNVSLLLFIKLSTSNARRVFSLSGAPRLACLANNLDRLASSTTRSDSSVTNGKTANEREKKRYENFQSRNASHVVRGHG